MLASPSADFVVKSTQGSKAPVTLSTAHHHGDSDHAGDAASGLSGQLLTISTTPVSKSTHAASTASAIHPCDPTNGIGSNDSIRLHH
jgi:hypothetical protein